MVEGMAGPISASATMPQYPSLSPDQQSLLLAALSSNDRKSSRKTHPSQTANGPTLDTRQEQNNVMFQSPLEDDLGSSRFDSNTFDHNPLFDFTDGDASFDTGLLQGLETNGYEYPNISPSRDFDNEAGEKRLHEDDDDDDDIDPKRREGDDKISKKPGRKPLTSEPTTKRKAQNRAAQRAFRERKEKHVKDMEQKVGDLERASNSANHENGLLRAQIERLQEELRDYRRRLSSGNSFGSSPTKTSFSSTSHDKTSRVATDFDFDFPKFGSLPRTHFPIASQNSNSSNTASEKSARGESNSTSPRSGSNSASSGTSGPDTVLPTSEGYSAVDQLGGLFTSEFLNAINNDTNGFSSTDSPVGMNSSHREDTFARQQNTLQSSSGSAASNHASPCSSTLRNCPSLSYDTSPEPCQKSPHTYKPISEFDSNAVYQDAITAKTPNVDFTNFDWLAIQNGGQFDPVLFGDYRESQDAIVGDGDFSGGFFEDAFSIPDWNDPFHAIGPPDYSFAGSDLMKQVEQQRDGDAAEDGFKMAAGDKKDLMTCQTIWNTLQNCPKFKAGDLDIDSLCVELQTKARCTETGVVVPKEDVEAVLWRLAGSKKPTEEKT